MLCYHFVSETSNKRYLLQVYLQRPWLHNIVSLRAINPTPSPPLDPHPSSLTPAALGHSSRLHEALQPGHLDDPGVPAAGCPGSYDTNEALTHRPVGKGTVNIRRSQTANEQAPRRPYWAAAVGRHRGRNRRQQEWGGFRQQTPGGAGLRWSQTPGGAGVEWSQTLGGGGVRWSQTADIGRSWSGVVPDSRRTVLQTKKHLEGPKEAVKLQS